jgi:hypothetical protein
VFERVGSESGEARRFAASLVDANLTGHAKRSARGAPPPSEA